MLCLNKNIQNIYIEPNLSTDKSIFQRAIIIAAISEGISYIKGDIDSKDVEETLHILEQLNIPFTQKNSLLTIKGTKNFIFPNIINFGNSATTARLLVGLFSTYKNKIICNAKNNLSKRSMKELILNLQHNGSIINSNDYKFPLIIEENNNFKGFTWYNNTLSAQIKSSLLLSAVNIQEPISIIEKIKSRNHTEILLQYFGAEIFINDHTITMNHITNLSAQTLDIPKDPSSAAFWFILGSLHNNSEIYLKNVLYDKIRLKYIDILIEMGCNIKITEITNSKPFKSCNIKIISNNIKIGSIETKIEDYPALVDEYIVLSIIASFAKGKSTFKGLKGLKNKESNRFDSLIYILKTLKKDFEIVDDNIIIHGNNIIPESIYLNSHDDHRLQMSLVTLAIAKNIPIYIDDISIVNKSYKYFYKDIESIK